MSRAGQKPSAHERHHEKPPERTRPPSTRPAAGHRGGLLLSAIRHRAAASTVLFVVAVVATLAAVVGPIYLAAADDSVVTSTVRAAPAATTELNLGPPSSGGSLGSLESAAALPTPGGRIFGAPVFTVDDGIVSSRAGTPFVSDLVSRTGVCAQLHLVSGHCPTGVGETVASTRTAKLLRFGVGSRIALNLVHSPFQGARTANVTVTGLYRAGNPQAPYWGGTNYFGYGSSTQGGVTVDAFFVTKPEALAATGSTTKTPLLPGSVSAQLPLRRVVLTTALANRLPAAIRGYSGRLGTSSFHVVVTSGLGGVLGQASRDESRMASIVAVVTLQLVLLALIVLYAVGTRTGELREPELALARLRGLKARQVVLMALLEPATLLLAALPIGLVLGWLGVLLLAPRLLVSGTPVDIDGLAIAAAVATFAAGLLTLAAASWRLVRPAARRTTGARRGAALDTAAVALAAAGLVELTTAGVGSGRHEDPVAAFAPGLLAVGVAVLGLRLLPLGCRLLLGPTRDSRFVAAFLGLRQLVRRPTLLRQIPILAVAFALLTFAVAGWTVAARNRETQAKFAVGAAEELTVRPASGVNLERAVRRADPSGREAMAVIAYSSGGGDLLAVDASRFAAVASWPTGVSRISASRVAAVLTPRTAPEVDLTGTQARVTLTRPPGGPARYPLQLNLFDEFDQDNFTVATAPVTAGTHSYLVALGGQCLAGCRLVSVNPLIPPSTNRQLQMSIASLAVRSGSAPWRTVPAGFADPKRWTATNALVDPGAGSALNLTFLPSSGAPVPTVAPADLPAHIPVVATPTAVSADSPGELPPLLSVEGLDGSSLIVAAKGEAQNLPRIGSDAVLVDLTLAGRAQGSPPVDTTDEVWLAAPPSTALLQRLSRAGLTIVSTDKASTLVNHADHEGTALAYELFLFAAAAAAVLSVGAAAFAAAVAGRSRAIELAGLRAAGVGRRALRAALRVEQLTVTLAGVLLGVAAGLIAALLALPSVPELEVPPIVPLEFPTPWLPVAVVVLAALALLLLATETGVRGVLRAATTDQLRLEAP